MDKKILIASTFATFGLIAFLAGYLLVPEQNSNQQTGTLLERFNNNVDINSPGDKTPGSALVSSRKFISFVIPFTNTQKIIAADESGGVIEIDTANLQEKVLADLKQDGVSETLLSPRGDSIVYSFYDSKNNKKHAYLNFSAKGGPASGGKKGETKEMIGDIKSVAFSPNGDQAVYFVNNSGSGELLISKEANVIKRALKIRLDTVLLDWPSGNVISVIAYNKDDYGDLFTLEGDGVFNKILSYQHDLNVKWSPLGERVLFSEKDGTGSDKLFYKDIQNNGTIVVLDMNANASKCIWTDEENIICGFRNQAQLKDEFYKISLSDKSKKLVATPSINLFAKELALNRLGDTLFVLNEIDSRIYSLKLGM